MNSYRTDPYWNTFYEVTKDLPSDVDELKKIIADKAVAYRALEVQYNRIKAHYAKLQDEYYKATYREDMGR
jgi:hypothetical protein